MRWKLDTTDLRIEEHIDHARRKITTVAVYRLRPVAKSKEYKKLVPGASGATTGT